MNNRLCDDCEHFAYCGCGPDCVCGVCLLNRKLYLAGLGNVVPQCTGFKERDPDTPMKLMKDNPYPFPEE